MKLKLIKNISFIFLFLISLWPNFNFSEKQNFRDLEKKYYISDIPAFENISGLENIYIQIQDINTELDFNKPTKIPCKIFILNNFYNAELAIFSKNNIRITTNSIFNKKLSDILPFLKNTILDFIEYFDAKICLSSFDFVNRRTRGKINRGFSINSDVKLFTDESRKNTTLRTYPKIPPSLKS